MKTVYAFIDSQNLNLGVKNDITRDGKVIYNGWKLDFKKFYIYLKTKYNVSKAFLFIGKVEGNDQLYSFLERSGYTIVFKPTIKHTNGDNTYQVKGNVDAELVLHTMIEFQNYDQAIIISGDGDYYCLIDYLDKKNKLLHVIIPNKYQYSSLLRSYNNYFVFITDLEAKLKLI